ncbi:MAG: hypothetical protein P4L50_28415 [Anaerolineaceae bacterium]|nr:hypothetical protein [Anaerolineaceae bacterium]
MPIIFYDQAIRAIVDGRQVDWIKDEHLTDWRALASALGPLTPEERCDAIYADWLLQLNSPAHLALLQVRNLLIGQGALAANYLAELAQNADDASDGEIAHIRIELSGDWLFVSNNGRMVTPLNLLGLSRFFVHTAGKVVELNEHTIGRFGIGFKSCYRIASEVFVHTWNGESDRFCFRLPVCREDDPASYPEPKRLRQLVEKLHVNGVSKLEQNPDEVSRLGYCTPEFLSTLPGRLAEKTASLCETSRGTLFCFHIRPDRLSEVQSRISDQAHKVYELCPLFLPNVRLVRLGRHELRMHEIRHDIDNDLPGKVEAIKVELTTLTDGEKPSNSRFWRLHGIGEGDAWQVALHADQKFRLRVEQDEDEHGTTIKDGAAYAFFPLNAVTKTWPFRLHLHLKLPTNLARDDWNPDETALVQEQIRRAAAGMAAWLEQHTDKWHPDWRIESLVARKPNQNDTWAWHLWGCLCNERDQRKLVRTLNGGFAPAASTKGIYLVERSEVSTAWQNVLQWQPAGQERLELTAFKSDDQFPVAEVSAKEVAQICRAAVADVDQDDDHHRAAAVAFFGCHNLMFHRVPGVALDFLRSIQCQTALGNRIALFELCEQVGGAELTTEWHQAIKSIESWSRDVSWTSVSVGGKTLAEQFDKLSEPKFNPAWLELSVQLASEEQWKTKGQQFWATPRSRCPASAKLSALTCIRVSSQGGEWLSIANLWLDDDSKTDCFGGLLAAWDRPWTDNKRKDFTEKLKDWDLWDSWEQSIKTLLKEKLPGILAQRLAENSHQDAFAVVFNAAFESARRPLDDAWKHIVQEAEKSAVRRLLTAQMAEAGLNGKKVISKSVAEALRAALCLLSDYVVAPPWLTDSAYKRITDLGLVSNCDFDFLSQSDVTAQQEHLSRELLEKFYQWQPAAVLPTAMTGLGQLSAATSLTKRREWQLGLGPQKPRRLRDLIVPTSTILQTTASSRLQATLLAGAKWDGEDLPASLAVVGSLAEACIQPSKLTVDAIAGTLSPLETEQLAAELTALPDFQELSCSGNYRLLGSPNELNLKWRYEGDIVARRDDAPFAVEADRIIVHRFRPPADEEQCKRVLAIFETNSTVTRDYEAEKNQSPFECYQKHRETIRETLLKELVAKVGYEKHHILRELLQNAESAYASKLHPLADAWFDFTIVATSVAGHRKVVARHAGRTFNEPDVTGKPRDDVGRIWRLAADNQRTADEVGRFNRGFKTLFTVAENGAVHIRSGDYDFEVIDLLMLKPANPQPNPGKNSPLTEFTFEACYQDALDLLQLDSVTRSNIALPVVNSATFVFLSHLERVSVKFEQRSWQWRIKRTAPIEGWRQVTIAEESNQSPDTFFVFTGTVAEPAITSSGRKYAAAMRVDAKGLPVLLEKAWRKFHLTFRTDHDFPLDFLVNGDFDADQGRVKLHNISQSGLVELAYDAVIKRAEVEIRKSPACAVWLAWARVLHLKEAATLFSAGNEFHLLHRYAQKATEQLSAMIPHVGELVAASSLEFPSLLLRRLGGVFGPRWHFNQRLWIDSEIAAALPEGAYERRRVTFLDWILSQQPDSPILRMVDADLRSEDFTRLRLSATEKDEFDRAKVALAEKLRPAVILPPPEPEIPVVEAWSVENLWHWWERHNKPMSEYTLEGTENWRLLYGDDTADTNARRARLKADLLSVSSTTPSPDGLRVWYRLFGLACLMSAGRRMSEVRTFWETELDGNRFWERTSAKTFSEGTDAMFAEVTTRPFTTLSASGENAYFWRRVFYDIRKIHRLVWQDQFPATLLELVQAGRSADLLNFLKTGYLPGQKPWLGVFGQSAGAPLFFVVRELCRLGVTPSNPEVRRLSFFVSTPARRAMERIGWITADTSNRVDFESLSSLSEALYRRIAADAEYGPRLLPYYDIPLLHLGLEG